MGRALLIKLGAIGDVVMAIPAAHALLKAGFAVDWVCGRTVAPVLALYPWIRTIVVDESRLMGGSGLEKLWLLSSLWRVIAGRSYEVCATLYYDRRYRALTLPVRAKRKVMLSLTERGTRLLPGRHHTDEYARIVLGLQDGLRAVGLQPVRPEQMPASPLPRDVRPRVLLAPGGARNLLREDALRRWPVEMYAEAARSLSGQGCEVVRIAGSLKHLTDLPSPTASASSRSSRRSACSARQMFCLRTIPGRCIWRGLRRWGLWVCLGRPTLTGACPRGLMR